MKLVLTTILFFIVSSWLEARTLTFNTQLKDGFPIYKKADDVVKACIMGNCQNGEGVFLIMFRRDVRTNDNRKNAMADVFMSFYVGTFSNNGQTIQGKTYHHIEQAAYTFSKKKNKYEPSKDLDLSKYVERSHIERGLPHFEGILHVGEENIMGIPEFLPEGECTIRFVKHSLSNEPFTQIEGLFSKGYPSYIKTTNYKNSQEIGSIVYEGRTYSLDMYREGKYYDQYATGTKAFDDSSYYMGEFLGNYRHGRGYEVKEGEVLHNGFWFFNEPVDISQFDINEYISYDNLEHKNLDDIQMLNQIGHYSGTVKSNQPHGYGTFSNNMFTYHGYFKDGKPEGLGTYTHYTYPDEKSGSTSYVVYSFVGAFRNGKPFKGKSAYAYLKRSTDYNNLFIHEQYKALPKTFLMFGGIHEGTVNDNGWVHGEGSITQINFDNGGTYRITGKKIGTFKNGRLHGNGYSDEIGIRKTGVFENGQFIGGEVEEHFSRLKQGDVIEVDGETLVVMQSLNMGMGDWFVELSNKLTYREDFKFKRSTKKLANLIEYHTCSSCKGSGQHSRTVKSTYMPTYSVERYQLVTTSVTKTYYNHGRTETHHINTKCGQCNGTGKVGQLKQEIK